jgi:hypothetical protein
MDYQDTVLGGDLIAGFFSWAPHVAEIAVQNSSTAAEMQGRQRMKLLLTGEWD